MSTTHALAGHDVGILEPGAGERLHFLGHLATVKVSAGPDGSMSVVEFAAPEGFGPPLHRHDFEDEIFIVLDGELAFHSGDDVTVGTTGSYAYLPRSIPHTFQVTSESARFVNVTAATRAVPQFDAMVRALGVPIVDGLPPPSYVDPGRVAAVCHDHGIEIVGPPPPPLL